MASDSSFANAIGSTCIVHVMSSIKLTSDIHWNFQNQTPFTNRDGPVRSRFRASERSALQILGTFGSRGFGDDTLSKPGLHYAEGAADIGGSTENNEAKKMG